MTTHPDRPAQSFRLTRTWLRLSRWQEHVPFTLALTLLGINMAVSGQGETLALDYRLPVVGIANVLAVTFAFMINDVEDAADDAKDPARGARNAITCGDLTRQEGWTASLVTAGMSLALFALLPDYAFISGALTVVLAGLYSWRAVRLKALPLVDVLSHVLMLSALLFLASYLAYDSVLGNVWLVAAGVTLISAYGQFYNQVRDYTSDQAAGLHNTASLLGLEATRAAMYVSIGLAVIVLGVTIWIGLWPLWLAAVPVIMSPLALLLRPKTDMRGSTAIDASGRVQLWFMLMADVVGLIWLVANLIGQ